ASSSVTSAGSESTGPPVGATPSARPSVSTTSTTPSSSSTTRTTPTPTVSLSSTTTTSAPTTTTLTPPGAPRDVSALPSNSFVGGPAEASDAITVHWSVPTGAISGFHVIWSPGG